MISLSYINLNLIWNATFSSFCQPIISTNLQKQIVRTYQKFKIVKDITFPLSCYWLGPWIQRLNVIS
jgi:hypothetical protein